MRPHRSTNQKKLTQKHKSERGAVLLWTALVLLFIVIPLVGLAIDGGTLYAIKAKLQTATDGAALAAARSLSRGLDWPSQQNSARVMAERFFAANVPQGWLGMQNPHIDVTFPPAPPQTIRVHIEATVEAPTYFMGLWRTDPITVAADGESSRRDVNVMVVLDRSKSLEFAGACDDLREAAKTFVQSFVDGRDRLGLVTFGTNYRVDFVPAFDFQSRAGSNVPTMIQSIVCSGFTNSASGYWKAWQELLTINEPGTLNVVVFFTDGQPNTVHMPALKIKATSSCTNKSDKNAIVTACQVSSGCSYTQGVWGLFTPTAGPIPVPDPDLALVANSNNCKYATNGYWNAYQDVVALTEPGAANEIDTFGNKLTGYKSVLRDGSGRIRIDHGPTMESVGINALDDAALRVRSLSAANGLNILTYAIGLGGTGSAEDTLLNRIANTEQSPIYDSTKQTGKYVYASNASQLNQAFASIASDILRLSK